MRRRNFLQRAGLSVGALSAGAVAAVGSTPVPRRPEIDAREGFRPDDWSSVRDQFALTRSRIHMASFLLASHPRPVADEIERQRRAFDEDPVAAWHEHRGTVHARIRAAAVEYMGGDAEQIALTDSTTMGLGLLYGSIRLSADQEAVCTTHCHYSTQMAWEHRAERDGARVRQASLYADPAATSVDEIVASTRRAITDRTRVFAVTWVHSCTGVKLPIAAMAAAIREINALRDERDRVIFCVDGVHGFGIEDVRIDELGCDFFVAGTHKWIFGPRGTGVVWARPGAWDHVTPVIPSFGPNTGAWLGALSWDQVPSGARMTPGGFHSFEHRWALAEAFRFHLAIGKQRVQERIHGLNTMTKSAMAGMKHVRLHTPTDPELSAGIICFEVEGLEPMTVVERFAEQGITASSSPYRVSYPRLAPSLMNDEAEIERTMQVLRTMA